MIDASQQSINERFRINSVWLLQLRWVAAAGQLIAILSSIALFGGRLPLAPLLSSVVILALSNMLWHTWLRKAWAIGFPSRAELGDRALCLVMAFDITLLSTQLAWSGGPSNPFAVFFLVNVGLVAAVVQSRWVWAMHGWTLLCFLAILFVYRPLPPLSPDDIPTNVWFHPWPGLREIGLALGVALAATVIVSFIYRLNGEIQAREEELRRSQQRASESEKLEALATLAAGAAHELATPLSTIAIVARELERDLARQQDDGVPLQTSIGDAKMIRKQLDHCRSILDRMAVYAGGGFAEESAAISVAGLVTAIVTELTQASRVRTELDPVVASLEVRAPKIVLSQALRGLVQNAIDASPEGDQVRITARHDRTGVEIAIADHGPGMREEVLRRVGEPFFTTKAPGSGMGLGVFLARSLTERLGGRLRFVSDGKSGTTAVVRLPLVDRGPSK